MSISSLAAVSEGYSQERDAIEIEKTNSVAIERVLGELGLEITQRILGEAEKLPEIKDPAVLTVICADGNVIIPNTGAVLINPDRDPLQIHNFLNSKPWGEILADERQKGVLIPCATRLSIDRSRDFHDVRGQFGGLSGRVSFDEEEDSVGGLRIKEYQPDSKLNPLAVEGLTERSVFGDENGKGRTPGDEKIFNKAKALVMAKLAVGAADQSDTRQPMESFDHVDSVTG